MKLPMAMIALLLAGCAARPAEVRVGFTADAVTSVAARGYADRSARRRVTADDPVRVASVSKLVVALGMMRLVEAGTLNLDRDVSEWLGWRLRNPAYPDAPITLRLLLSHRSSLTDGADYAIPLGGTVRETVALPAAWDAAHGPGSYFRYANLNFPVIASVIEKATGERFDKVMAREVLAPLGIDACFNWTTCSDAAVARAVTLHDASGPVRRDPPGPRPACPVFAPEGDPCDLSAYQPGDNGALFSPQGGLRISARGLARIGQLLLKRGEGLLKPESIDAIERAAWTFDGTNGDSSNGFYCRYGLGVTRLPTPVPGCADDLFGDARERIGHAGEAYGLRSGLWIDRAAGTGVAFFATAVPDEGAKGKRSAFTAAEERLAEGR